MTRLILPFALLAGLFTSACVTINVYFPAAAAQAAADRVIDEVWGEAAQPAPPPAKPVSQWRDAVLRVATAGLDFLLPTAQAADPNIDVSSPAIRELTASMEARFPALAPFLDSGAIGIGRDGFIATRDAGSVPLAQRNQLRTLVANENADRSELYRQIAVANGNPQWETQIREVFATRWTARAKAGWYVETRDGWKQK